MRFALGALVGFAAGAFVAMTSRAVGVALADARQKVATGAGAGDAG
jgi:hypothetical protein